jgi:signal transduction histidine kinase
MTHSDLQTPVWTVGVRAFDWASTPLGPRSGWPSELQVIVDACLSSPVPMIVLWGEQLIQIYNSAYAVILGDRHPLALGQPTQACWPEVWHINAPLYAGVFQGETFYFENQLYPINRGGRLENAHFTLGYSPLYAHPGEVGGVLVTVMETSGQVRSERRLQMLRTLSLNLLESSDLGAISAAAVAQLAGSPDTPFALLYVVQDNVLTLQGATGLAVNALVPECLALSGPRTDSPDAWLWPQLLDLHQSRDLALPDGLDFTDGAVRPHQALAVPLRRTTQDPAFGLLVFGLSPHLPLDRAYREYLELIGVQVASSLLHVQLAEDQRRRAVDERTHELHAVNEELEAFSYSVSHDLRSPVRHISGFSALLQRSLDGLQGGEALQPHVTIIRQAAERMNGLIDDLLQLARQGREPLHLTEVELQTVLNEVLGDVQADTVNRRVTWLIRPLPRVLGDAALLRVVLTNLLSNALKYSRARPEAQIEVVALDARTEHVIEVRDNGVGFNARYADRLFKVFQRLHRAEDYEGTGVGLVTVQRIVHRHHGRVWAKSVQGEGATFGFSLPKSAPEGVRT